MTYMGNMKPQLTNAPKPRTIPHAWPMEKPQLTNRLLSHEESNGNKPEEHALPRLSIGAGST